MAENFPSDSKLHFSFLSRLSPNSKGESEAGGILRGGKALGVTFALAWLVLAFTTQILEDRCPGLGARGAGGLRVGS
jgi:hypothetical protein